MDQVFESHIVKLVRLGIRKGTCGQTALNVGGGYCSGVLHTAIFPFLLLCIILLPVPSE